VEGRTFHSAFVSIHALLRARTFQKLWRAAPSKFQSTRSCEREPETHRRCRFRFRVSIHALLRARTCSNAISSQLHVCFNPRAPASANDRRQGYYTHLYVSIHALLRARTGNKYDANGFQVFQSTRSCEREHGTQNMGIAVYCFNPRAPASANLQ